MENPHTPLGAWADVIRRERPSTTGVAAIAFALLVLPFALLLLPSLF